MRKDDSLNAVMELRRRFRTEMTVGDESAKRLAWHGQQAFDLMSDGRIAKVGTDYAVAATLIQLRIMSPPLTRDELKHAVVL